MDDRQQDEFIVDPDLENSLDPVPIRNDSLARQDPSTHGSTDSGYWSPLPRRTKMEELDLFRFWEGLAPYGAEGSSQRASSRLAGVSTPGSAASERAAFFAEANEAARFEALCPADQMLHGVRAPGGFTRFSELDINANAIPCMPISGGRGLPLASLLEETVEAALEGGPGPSQEFFAKFETDERLLWRGVWEATMAVVMGSILYCLWRYHGRSQSLTEMITVLISGAGSLGIVARSFSARGYLGAVYAGRVGSGVVDLRLVSAGSVNAFFSKAGGVCAASGYAARAFRVCVLLAIAAPALLLLSLASLVAVFRYVFHLVVGSENDGSWVLRTGVLRSRGRLMVLPFLQKRVVGIDHNECQQVQWPGGAWRTYYGSRIEPGAWALYFQNRSSFLTELGCDTVSLQFGIERRLVVEVGRRTLSFVIAARDGRGGLMLVPVEASPGVRVRLSTPSALCGATGGVTILMSVEYPTKVVTPEEEVARVLRLEGDAFCLDVSACGIGAREETGPQVYDVLDGAGTGIVSDKSALWRSLSSMCFPSARARWAAGFYGGHFSELVEVADNGDTEETYQGQEPGLGRRCVIDTPSEDAPRNLSDFDVVVGVRAHGRGMLKVPVNQRDGYVCVATAADRRFDNIRTDGIAGKFCLVPGGQQATWKYQVDKKKERMGDCEECLLSLSGARYPALLLTTP